MHLQKRDGHKYPVLLKEPAHEIPTHSSLEQIYNEYDISNQLEEVSGVRPTYAIEGTESKPTLLLEFIPGQSLTELIRFAQLNMSEKLHLALNVATVLKHIHEQKVMHKDICCSNILVAGSDMPGSQKGVYIIDFGKASPLVKEHPARMELFDRNIGTLAYISPEQKIGRASCRERV